MNTLEDLIATFTADNELELEMCLCRKNANERPNELAQDVAHHIATTLQKAAQKGHFTSTNCSFVDYFYEDGAIRHRCFLDENKEAQTIRKTRVNRVLATCPQRDYVFCFNLKREEHLKHFDSLEAGCPHHVRIQQEWTFEYKNAFQYVVKKVQSGGTSKEECLERPLHFEVEIELIAGSEYARQRNAAQLARSLIEKCLDMCGRFDDTNQIKEPLTMVFERKHVDDDQEDDVVSENVTRKRSSKRETAASETSVRKQNKRAH